MSEIELVCLRWMMRCNDQHRIGFLYETVARRGAVPECQRLVDKGMALCVFTTKDRERRGYWILPAGRESLGVKE